MSEAVKMPRQSREGLQNIETSFCDNRQKQLSLILLNCAYFE